MHKSRLGTLVLDCGSDDFDRDTAFWGQALNCRVLTRNTEPGDENYRRLDGDPAQPKMLLQRVDHPSRVHIDIETDDIEAEVARLEKLGARRVEKVQDFWVLEAPTGHRFCVVNPQRADFQEDANVWDHD